VDIFGCGIKDIPDKAFSHLSEVRVLNLEYNQLTEVRANALVGMSNLKVLWLTGHHIQKDEYGGKAMPPMSEYNKVDALKNEIKTIDERAFADNGKLAVLLMHHNKIESVPEGVFSTPKSSLRVLKLLDNPMTAKGHGLAKGKGPFAGFANCHQFDLDYDSGDVLEDQMEGGGFYLNDDNGDETEWWKRPPQQEGDDGEGDGADDDQEEDL